MSVDLKACPCGANYGFNCKVTQSSFEVECPSCKRLAKTRTQGAVVTAWNAGRFFVDRHHSNATHLLECRHCIGQSCKTYRLRCHVLKDMGDGRLKVQVFGTMWKGQESVSRVRYVESFKVSERA